ncbi:DUF6325 family protein [Nocardioides taihuensis]|uniref:DUF6325 family protein n=1 Tax=Nocardioides taihuensis TaxID=1835606 RepID=A0ABW0BID8_9ACTN
MTEDDVYGPVDFVLMEFEGDRLTGRGAVEILDLVDRGIVRIYDIAVIGKTDDGEVYAVDLAQEAVAAELGDFGELVGARSGLLGDEDVAEAANAMEPGRLAVLIVFENTWAVPFIRAVRASGGELIASARIPAQDVMDAMDALDQLSPI